jgi:ATP-dependent Clp endopeptidase proteolytic subunit ClpP
LCITMAKQILLYGIIGGYYYDGITAAGFRREFSAALASGEEIEIRINTPGGSIMDGVAIYNTIIANNANVTTINDGFAYSMGAVIMMAGKKRKGMKNSTTMIHNGSGMAVGNAREIEGSLETLKKLDNAMAESLAALSGKSVADITAKYLDYRDHTLSADEALAEGFLTEVIQLNSEAVPKDAKAMSQAELFAFYANLYHTEKEEGFINRMATAVQNLIHFKPAAAAATLPTDDMKIKITGNMAGLLTALSISANAGEEVDFTADHLEKLNALIASKEADLVTAKEANATATAYGKGLMDKITKVVAVFKTNATAQEVEAFDLVGEITKLKSEDADPEAAAKLKAEKEKETGDSEYDAMMNKPLSQVTKH